MPNAMSSRPAQMSQRLPTLSERRPANGAENMTATDSGLMTAPAFMAL